MAGCCNSCGGSCAPARPTRRRSRQTLDELKKTEAAGPERTRADFAELDAALSPLQQAKYRVLELEVEQRLRELMGRARQRGERTRPPRD